MQKGVNDIVIFLVAVSALIIMMVTFIISILWAYRKRQLVFERSLAEIKLDHEKTVLAAQLEMQEQTFEHISKEIHDNINLSLTLVKLNLNTLDWNDKVQISGKINSSVELLTKSISELSNLSKGLNADILIENGLVRTLEMEISRIRNAGTFQLEFDVTGNPIFLSTYNELIIFRIIQEAFNNIIKHSKATRCSLELFYGETEIIGTIQDDGIGFEINDISRSDHAGLKNIQMRVKSLGGTLKMDSVISKGTTIEFKFPYGQNS